MKNYAVFLVLCILSTSYLVANASGPESLSFSPVFSVQINPDGSWRKQGAAGIDFEALAPLNIAPGTGPKDRGFADPQAGQFYLVMNVRETGNDGVLFDAVLPSPGGEDPVLVPGLGGTSVPFARGVHPFDIDTTEQFLDEYTAQSIQQYGSVLIAHMTGPGRKALSRILDLQGRPMTALLPRIYESRLEPGGLAEFAMQTGSLETAYGPTPLLFHPIDSKGQPLPLPEGVLGMVPLQMETGICWNWFRNDGACEALEVGRHTGWALVYDGVTGLEYSWATGNANEVIENAPGSERLLGLRYIAKDKTDRESGNWLAAQSPGDALWYLHDPFTLELVSEAGKSPEMAFSSLESPSAKPNPWATVRETAQVESLKADIDRLNREAAARAARQRELELDPKYGSRVFLARMKQLTSDPDTILWAAIKVDCETYLEEVKSYPSESAGLVNNVGECGESPEFVRQYAPKAYKKWEKNQKRASRRAQIDGLIYAMQNYRINQEPEDVNVLIISGGRMDQRRMSREHYDNYYNPATQ